MRTLMAGFILVLLLPTACFAVLGEAATDTMRSAARAMTARSGSNLTVHQHTEKMTPIKEFIGADGAVYAVSWHGHVRPDLNALLGKYFSEYRIAVAAPTRRIAHRGMTATSGNLEIREFGRPGDLHGVIYVKSKLPQNVNWEDLQ